MARRLARALPSVPLTTSVVDMRLSDVHVAMLDAGAPATARPAAQRACAAASRPSAMVRASSKEVTPPAPDCAASSVSIELPPASVAETVLLAENVPNLLWLVDSNRSDATETHRDLETLVVDRESMHIRDSLIPKYAQLVYNGFWFAPEREMLQAAIDHSQAMVTGQVRVKLYKGNVTIIGRESPYSLYDQDLVTFEEGVQAYDHNDAAGFIKLNALRLRVAAKRDRRG